MGYELKRLMGQFGVSTPGMVNYSGAAAPGKAPDSGATQADRDAFSESVRKYNLDNKSYDIYKKEYENRLQNSPGMYSQTQFNTASSAPSTAYSYSPMAQRVNAPGGIGIDQANRDIQNWFASNPGATPSERAAIQQKYGVSDRDTRNAMGTAFNPDRGMVTQVMAQPRTPLTAPTYGAVGLNTQLMSDADRQAYYNSQRKIGYTMGDLKANAEKTFGVGSVTDPNWHGWESQYNPAYVPSASPVVATGSAPPVTTTTDTAATDTAATNTSDGQYFDPNNPYWEYSHGGAVKTHYQTAGRVSLPGGYVEEEDTMPPAAVMPPAVAAAPNDRMADLQTMLKAYGPSESIYAEELKTSRDRAQQESDAFAEMLSNAMSSPESDSSSKAELYFRLASAFGAPTKTGQFSENLGMVGQQMSEYAKDRRASSQDKLNLALKAQELKMGAAKEDLSTLRSLAAEEMRDKRAIGTEMIKEYVASGKPQSNAGKQAQDEGLQLGTPEFNARVQELAQIDIDRKIQMTQLQLDNLSLRSEQQQQLSPTEIALKVKTEDNVGNLSTALANLAEAYRIKPNSLPGGWVGKTRQFLGNISSSDDPIYVNTRQIENLLGSQALEQLRATFGGAPTEGERAILLELQGIGAASLEDRAKIMMRAYAEVQKSLAREQGRLEQINSRAYRMPTPPATIDGGVQ